MGGLGKGKLILSHQKTMSFFAWHSKAEKKSAYASGKKGQKEGRPWKKVRRGDRRVLRSQKAGWGLFNLQRSKTTGRYSVKANAWTGENT